MDAIKSFFVDVKRGSFSPEVLPDDENLLDRFKGCMAGALLGDCLGYFYEEYNDVDVDIRPFELLSDLDAGLKRLKLTPKFTDDTVFTVALAESFLERDGFNAVDFARRYALFSSSAVDPSAPIFVASWKKFPGRCYGCGIKPLCTKFEKMNYVNPPAIALTLWDGGSFGNGAAMRIMPVALLYHDDEDKLVCMAEEVSKVTHAHRLGYLGGVLLALAMHLIFKEPLGSVIEANAFLGRLIDAIGKIEAEIPVGSDSDSVGETMNQISYAKKLEAVRELLEKEASIDEVVTRLGNEDTAHRSVPTAIYCFLKCLGPISGFSSDSSMERTIALACDIGGDTDTIGTMAGALSGVHVGFEGVPKTWLSKCEQHERSVKLGDRLYAMYKRHNNAKRLRKKEVD
ncbi:unnamed protein product [Notodromas monacha]|uniref:ADP-ribosylhydrolase ARH3 n=1 Tax=Notodromas monacha TaxID=399045 RepID=A0A7R9BDV6_9CRUS|nr:unnamed protein product [Notodromas monacha]CAG0912850.1 unnamed protein product [Notodromas monacha]